MKAKRGDSIAIVKESRSYVIGQGSTTKTEVELATVTNITRDGQVKAFRSAWGGAPQPLDRVIGFKQLLVIPNAVVSNADVMAVASAHHYVGHPGQPKSWDSLEEVREALKPYRVAVPA